MNKEIYDKIVQKKEFSQLPRKDVEVVYGKFEKREVSDVEKIRLTRDLLRKVFSGFTSKKLLSLKNKAPEWILRKHLSTRERLPYYAELYKKIIDSERSVIDLGAGINGFSYNYLPRGTSYFGIEAVGQLVELMNYYFKTKVLNAGAIHLSLFEIQKVKKYIKQVKGKKVVFLFKTIDSLEMIQRDYSKKLLKEIVPLVDKVVVSFATRSMVSRKKFNVSRKWILEFISSEFQVLDSFELGGERYIVFKKR